MLLSLVLQRYVDVGIEDCKHTEQLIASINAYVEAQNFTMLRKLDLMKAEDAERVAYLALKDAGKECCQKIKGLLMVVS